MTFLAPLRDKDKSNDIQDDEQRRDGKDDEPGLPEIEQQLRECDKPEHAVVHLHTACLLH